VGSEENIGARLILRVFQHQVTGRGPVLDQLPADRDLMVGDRQDRLLLLGLGLLFVAGFVRFGLGFFLLGPARRESNQGTEQRNPKAGFFHGVFVGCRQPMFPPSTLATRKPEPADRVTCRRHSRLTARAPPRVARSPVRLWIAPAPLPSSNSSLPWLNRRVPAA